MLRQGLKTLDNLDEVKERERKEKERKATLLKTQPKLTSTEREVSVGTSRRDDLLLEANGASLSSELLDPLDPFQADLGFVDRSQ